MDIEQLYQDYGVDYVTEGHKHARPGWVNTECPFCSGNPGYHLGFHVDSSYYYCWRCGWHGTVVTIAKLTNLHEQQVRKLVRRYGLLVPKQHTEAVIQTNIKEHRLPSGIGVLTAGHIHYLEKRGYDPWKIQDTWQLMGTGPVSRLDNIDFKHRIIIPIIWNGVEVSFTSRDVTNKSNLRYITCPKSRELIEHKHILYGKQEAWGSTGICVEGPTDVWRLGVNSFATFGIEYTTRQVRAMAKAFKRIVVMFDDDPQAVIQADKLVAELRLRNVEAFKIESIVAQDPGSMRQQDADYLIKQLL